MYLRISSWVLILAVVLLSAANPLSLAVRIPQNLPEPPIFPEKFGWFVHLKEWHRGPDGENTRLDYAEGQYYFDYSMHPFATRQQNVVLPNTVPAGWRPDIPWNMFLAVNGTIYLGLFNAATGQSDCNPPSHPNIYDDNYWPRDLLRRPELCKFIGVTQTAIEFGGSYNDNKTALAYSCRSAAGSASFSGLFYTDLASTQIIRASLDSHAPWWNRQVWDTTGIVEMDFPSGYWTVPEWVLCKKKQ